MADETKYEVGQVVVMTGPCVLGWRKAGDQATYFGRWIGGRQYVEVGREGTIGIAEEGNIRPLRPGEAPTIDARGYPIEAKAERACQGAESRSCSCARLHPGQRLSSRAGEIEPAWHPDAAPLLIDDGDGAETVVAMANGLKLGRRIVRTVTETTVIERCIR